jgi:hypothetical protein
VGETPVADNKACSFKITQNCFEQKWVKDFSLSVHECFWAAFLCKIANGNEKDRGPSVLKI